jgi:rare lipoprotein A
MCVRFDRRSLGCRWCGLALLAVLLMLTACARKKPVRVPVTPAIGSVEYGIASWYGPPYHGRRAANGEVYDMEKLTAAHRTLPFETWVEVQNLSNDRKVEVRITDRGPFIEGRIIDLSRAAARELQMLGPGIVEVRITVIAPPKGAPAPAAFAVQVGAFSERANAEKLAASLRERYPDCRLVHRESSSPPWRVLVGNEASMAEAAALARELRRHVRAAFVVRVDDAPPGGL